MQAMGLFDFLDDVPDDWEPKQRLSPEETEQAFIYLKNHPLFMQEIPENVEDYPELMALQHLAYDDTPENIARSLNEKANEVVKTKGDHPYYLKQAIKIYSDGINQECNDKELVAKLFSNRAFVLQKQKNYKAAIQDCRWSIEHNPAFIKPYYRAAQCLVQIMHFSDAVRMCEAALQIDPKCYEVKALLTKSHEELKKMAAKKDAEKQLQELRKQCIAKGIALKPSQISLPVEYQPQRLSIVDHLINTPIVVTYPEFQQRDFVQQAFEDMTLKQSLAQLFDQPLPWDTQHQYDEKTVAFYIQLDDDRYARINSGATLLEIMKGYKVVIPMLIELLCLSLHPQNRYYKEEVRKQFHLID